MSEHKNRRQRIEEEAELTLDSLDDLEEIDVGPYFFAQVQAKLDASEEQESWLAGLFWGNRLAHSVLTVALILNVVTAYVVLRDDRSITEPRDESIEAVADEYLPTETSIAFDLSLE